MLGIIKDKGINISPEKIEEYPLDIKDKPFYELAIEKKMNKIKLVTGNVKHFPRIEEIITTNELVALIESEKYIMLWIKKLDKKDLTFLLHYRMIFDKIVNARKISIFYWHFQCHFFQLF